MPVQIDIEMPKSCRGCPFSFDWGVGGITDYKCKLAKGLRGDVNKRPLGCPLREVK